VSEPAVLYEKNNAVAWITLNRPATLNAVNLAMRDELWEALQAIRDDPDVRLAIIKGAGDRAFSAGADITEFGSAPNYFAARQARRDRDLWGIMLALNKPLIAATHGYAFGAGCEMALACDLRIAAEGSSFAMPEVSLGYIPSAGGTQLLPRTIRQTAAARMILSGEAIDAATALRLGLVHRVVPFTQLLDAATSLGETLLHAPDHSLRLAKQALRASRELTMISGLDVEAKLAVLAVHLNRHG
jgi:enoyl-CoA hydratase/carnithine racemase